MRLWLIIALLLVSLFGKLTAQDVSKEYLPIYKLHKSIENYNYYVGGDSLLEIRYDSLSVMLERYREIKGADNYYIRSKLFYANHLAMMNPSKAMEIMLELSSVATRKNYDTLTAYIEHDIGKVFHTNKLFDRAIEHYLRSVAYFYMVKDYPAYAYTLVDLGNIFYYKGDYHMAATYYLRSIDAMKQVTKKSTMYWGLALGYDNLGMCYAGMQMPDSAIYFYRTSIQYRKAGHARSTYYISYQHLASIFAVKNMQDSVLYYIHKALSITRDNNQLMEEAEVYISWAEIVKRADSLKAVSYIRKAVSLVKNMAPYNQAFFVGSLANAYDALENDSARIYAEFLLKYASGSRLYRKKAYEILNHYYSRKEDYKQANYYLNKLLDEYIAEQGEAMSKGEYTIQEYFWQQDKKLLQMAQEREKLINYLLSAIVLIALLIVFFLFSNRRKILKYSKRLKTSHQKLAEAHSKLEEEAKFRDMIYSVVAHDLKGPLGSASNMVKLIEEMPDDPELIKEYFPVLSQTLSGVNKLLADLLVWARIDSHEDKLKIEELNLHEIGVEVIEFVKPFAKDKDITIHCMISDDDCVMGDKKAVSTIFRNLLSNAVKYTYPGGKITIESSHKDQSIRVCVKDSGVGMTAEMIDKVLDVSCIESSEGTKKEKGTGLGLKITKAFVQMNKGSFGLESSPGKGTKAWFELPKP